jgi:hypothetical protein
MKLTFISTISLFLLSSIANAGTLFISPNLAKMGIPYAPAERSFDISYAPADRDSTTAVESYLNFDTTVLEVMSVTSYGGHFCVLNRGRIALIADTLVNAPLTSGRICSVRFKLIKRLWGGFDTQLLLGPTNAFQSNGTAVRIDVLNATVRVMPGAV